MVPVWRTVDKTAVTRFWWLRHGPISITPGTLKGQTDVACDLPVEAVAATRALLPSGAVVVASPLRRAMDTARALGLDPVHTDPALMEQDFGTWTGRTWDDLESEAAALGFWEAPATTRAPGGESFADQVARVGEAITRLSTAHAGRDVIVPCHAGVIRAALAVALGVAADPAPALGFVIAPLSLTRIDVFPGGGARIVCVSVGGTP
ncbi:MAG: histidine phosphatase family protein [Rhodospirillaceae bacterium]